MQKQLGFVALCLCLSTACGESDGQGETVAAIQEGVPAGENGVGLMLPLGLDMPDYGLAPDDVTVFIRSFDPNACSMAQAVDLFDGADGFQWSVFLMMPAAEVQIGRKFRFGGNECEGPDCVMGFADSIGGQAGPAGAWLGSGLRCDDDSYDLPVDGEIVDVGESSMTIELSNLCFTDYGPLEADLSDDPGDDVIHRVEGRFEVTLCSEPASRAP